MTDTSNQFHVPDGLRTAEFLLRPLRATDAANDYEALMESKEYLRLWEQTGWPADDFTVDANREDLERHEREHGAGESFTYTVSDPADTTCLGCVYIQPTTSRWLAKAQVTALSDEAWTDYRLAVLFWVRKSQMAGELDHRLLEALGEWLRSEWGVPDHLVITNEHFTQQVGIIESAGLERRFRLAYANQPGEYLAYASKAP